jgi:hypothetical protein
VDKEADFNGVELAEKVRDGSKTAAMFKFKLVSAAADKQ